MRLLICLLFTAMAWGQVGRTVTLTWDDLTNPTGTTYTIYRANGACSGTPAYVSLATAIAVKTYDNTGMLPGKYCYAVSATYGGEESVYSDPAAAQVRPNKPTNLRSALIELLAWMGRIVQGDKQLRVVVH